MEREADGSRYVINSEAAKALYKTMPGRTTSQPKDLSREWHSDGLYPFISSSEQSIDILDQQLLKSALRISAVL